jgi:predicted ribosomally synthesized peptide with SipW-like signal peptide
MSRRLRDLFGAAWLGVAGLAVGAFASSTAFFTDQEVVASNQFTTATLDLTAAPVTALLSTDHMQPGDTVSGTLTMSNTGSVELRYAMTSSATDDGKGLRSILQLTIRTAGTSCAAFDGTILYSGVIANAAFGNPAVGSQSGDRTLANGASETLCFRAELPTSATNAYQQATTTVSFTFNAEQTAHNP